MLAYPGIREPVDPAVRWRTSPPYAARDLSGHRLGSPAGGVDFPDAPMERQRLNEDGVRRLAHEVREPFPLRSAASASEPSGELARMTAEDDHVSDGQKVREVSDDDIHVRRSARSPRASRRPHVDLRARADSPAGTQLKGKVGHLDGPPSGDQPGGNRALPGPGGPGQRHRGHRIPLERRE